MTEQTQRLEEVWFEEEQKKLIWKKLCKKWAYGQNWSFPTRIYIIYNYDYEEMTTV